MSTAKSSTLETLSSRFDEPADLFRVLANPTRLMLLCHIAKGECSVGQTERELGLRNNGRGGCAGGPLERELGRRKPGLSQPWGDRRQTGLL